MKKFIVATDSTSNIQSVVPHTDIDILPLYLHMKDKKLRDNIDITAQEFLSWMCKHPDELPFSSPPTENDIHEMIGRWISQGYQDALFVTLSSAISETHNLVRHVAEQYKKEIRVMVFDSKSVMYTQIKLTLAAKALLEQGHSLPTVMTKLEFMRRQGSMFFTIATLNYLIKNGRLSANKGKIAQLLRVHPILTFDEHGHIIPIGKKHGAGSALKDVIQREVQVVDGQTADFFITASEDETGKRFLKYVNDLLGGKNNYTVMLPSPVIACHTGPGIYAMGAFTKPSSAT